jgi:hypothetical protein
LFFSFSFFLDRFRLIDTSERERLDLTKEREKKKKKTPQVDLLERQVAALIAASPSSARTAVADAMSRIPSSVALSSAARVEDEEATSENSKSPTRPSSLLPPPRPPSQVFSLPSSSSTPTLAETARPPLGEPVASEDGSGGAGGAKSSRGKNENEQQQQQQQQERPAAARAPSSPSSLPPPVPLEPVPMSATRVVLHQLVTPTDVDDLGICSGERQRKRSARARERNGNETEEEGEEEGEEEEEDEDEDEEESSPSTSKQQQRTTTTTIQAEPSSRGSTSPPASQPRRSREAPSSPRAWTPLPF